MKKIQIIIPVAIAAVAVVVWLAQSEGQQERQETEPSLQSQMAFIDPETGELTSQPQENGSITIPSSPSLRLGDGIASPPQKMGDGSMKIEFNGQFNKPLRASIDQNGEVKVGHHDSEETKKTDD